MPPTPPPQFPLYIAAAVLILLLLSSADASPPRLYHNCAPHHPSEHLQPCSPFPSPPSSFPFSSQPGCGHPSFQIRCSSSFSIISIHSAAFRLLALHHDNSLTISPYLPVSSSSFACPVLPSSPLDLSPFRLSGELCRWISSLVPCQHLFPNLSSCSLSPFQHQLVSNPLSLFPACSRAPAESSLRCTPDILTSISAFLAHGFLVRWDPKSDPYFSNCSACHRATRGLCGFNDSSPSKSFMCFPSPSHVARRHPRRVILIAAAAAASAAIISTCLIFAAVAKFRRHVRDNSISELLDRHQIQQTPLYTYEQLHSWTNGFDPRRKIGDGGFGTVYVAQLEDGRIAAVKRLHRRPSQPTLAAAACTRSFCNEIKILSSLRHPNLVRLHGYCCDSRGLVLVYDYVPNGTLADHLHGTRCLHRKASLTWAVRVDIALETALALEYLHFALKPPVVHRDITSCNIFVERDMRIKVGDFGLSRLLANGASSTSGGCGTEGKEEREDGCCTGPQGTPGYLDPEYHRTFRLTEKSDVYSFGVVMMELVTGMKAVDVRRDRREVSLADMVVGKIQLGQLKSVVDPVLLRQSGEETHMSSIEAVAELAFRCVANEKEDRPDAKEIVVHLTRIRSSIQESLPSNFCK